MYLGKHYLPVEIPVKTLLLRSAILTAALAGTPALAQTDRLPLPPTPSAEFSFSDAYRAAGRPTIAVLDFYGADAAHPAGDLSAQARLLGARVRDFFRTADSANIDPGLASGVSADSALGAVASVDAVRAAQLAGERLHADVVVVVYSEARTSADGVATLRSSYAAVDVRRAATIGQWVYEITPAAGRPSIDADRVTAFAGIIAADAQQRFTTFYRGYAGTPQAASYNQPLASAPVMQAAAAPTYAQQPVYVQEPIVVRQPVVVQQPVYTTPVYAAPVYTAPVVVREPVYVPASSWSVAVGYGWGSGRVGFAYGSPGYCAPSYYSPYCGWGGSAFALALNFGSYGGYHGHGGYHGGGGHHGGGGGHGGHH